MKKEYQVIELTDGIKTRKFTVEGEDELRKLAHEIDVSEIQKFSRLLESSLGSLSYDTNKSYDSFRCRVQEIKEQLSTFSTIFIFIFGFLIVNLILLIVLSCK